MLVMPNRTINPMVLFVFGLRAFSLLAQTQPQFTGAARLSNQEVVLKLTADTSTVLKIETASSLPQWQPLSTFLSGAINLYTDSAAAYLPARYYRAVQLPNSPLTGDYLVTDEGEILFHPINHATLVMQWKNTIIYSDPVGSSTLYSLLPKPALIFVTHEHGDHFNSATLNSLKGPDTKIITTRTVYNSLGTLKPAAIPLANGTGTNLLGIDIQAVPAYNTSNSNHPKGVGNGYVVTIGGKRLYISGDSEDIPEMRGLTDIDLAFLCMNTPYTMSVDKAASAVRQFRPKVVYPYHYRNGDGSYADLNAFKRKVGVDLGIEVRIRKWY